MKNKATITTAGTLALAAVLYFAGISPQDIPRILGSGEGRLSAPSASADADRMIAEAFHERRVILQKHDPTWQGYFAETCPHRFAQS